MKPQEQHRLEIEKNLQSWRKKPLLQDIYKGFYERILRHIDASLPGEIVELGSGIGNLKAHFPQAICTDLFPNPWLDIVCDGYELPFRARTVSHLVLFDVFHHLRTPKAFLREARRVLAGAGKLILFEPYVSFCSFFIYSLFHHEPLGWGEPIDRSERIDRPRDYYAAQGNATRIFFGRHGAGVIDGWKTVAAEPFSAFHYLFSGGYSKPALYPRPLLRAIATFDTAFSRWPRLFAARCLIVLSPMVREVLSNTAVNQE